MEHMEQKTGEEIFFNNNDDVQDIETLNRLYEESLDRIREGEIVQGKIVDFTNNAAEIDIGFKSTGYVSLSELAGSEEGRDVSVGDELEFLLLKREDEEGHPILSRRKVEEMKTWRHIEKVYDQDGTIKGKINSEIKGGFQVDVGLPAFLPTSQVDFKPVRDKNEWAGTDHEFKVLNLDRKTRNIVLSRRKNLEQEMRVKVRRQFKPGGVYEGTITSIADFGLFIDLGIIKGLVHKSNISWGKVDHPANSYSVGEQVRVKVLDVDEKSLRISLGIKQLEPNPWESLPEKYPVGTIIEGKISDIKDFGIFVGLDEEIDGLIHLSNISWTKPLYNPGEFFEKGQTIQALVMEIDQENERVTLGMKQLIPDPWDHIPERYRSGTYITGKLLLVSARGLIIRLEEGVEGIVPVSRLPKTENMPDFSEGEPVQVKVVSASPRSKKIELTIPKPEEMSDSEKNNTLDDNFAQRLKESLTNGL